MSDWAIQIPFRSRSDSLADVAEAARALPAGEERDIARQLALGALIDGTAASASGLLDHIEKLGPAQRRLLLDQARVAAGLEPTATVDARARAAAASRAGLQREAPQLVVGPSGGFVDLADQYADTGRAAAEAESRQCQREAKLAERQAEAAEHADHERARAEALRREFPDPMMVPR